MGGSARTARRNMSRRPVGSIRPGSVTAIISTSLNNGGFETLGGSLFSNWTDSQGAGTSVTQDLVDFDTGSASVKFTMPGDTSATPYIHSQITALSAGLHRIQFAAKSNRSDAMPWRIYLETSKYVDFVLTNSWRFYTFAIRTTGSTLSAYIVQFRPTLSNSAHYGAGGPELIVNIDSVKLTQLFFDLASSSSASSWDATTGTFDSTSLTLDITT